MVNKVAIYSCCALTYQIIWQNCAVLNDVLAQMAEQYLYTNSDVTVPFTANTWGQNYCFSMPFLFQVAKVSEVEILSDLFLSFFQSQVIFKRVASLRCLEYDHPSRDNLISKAF